MATLYQRPEGTYESTSTSVNASKYRNDSIAKTAIASNKVDGDLNYMIDAVNQLGVDIDDVVSGGVPDGSITTAKLADDAVTNTKIAEDAVGTAELINGSITNIKMAAASVNTLQLINESVTNAKIANSQVTEEKIANGSITEDKLSTEVLDDINEIATSVASITRPISDKVVYLNSQQMTWYGDCIADDGSTRITLASTTPLTATITEELNGDTRTVSAGVSYYLFVYIDDTDSDSVKGYFSTSETGADITFDAKRLIAPILTDSVSGILEPTTVYTIDNDLYYTYTSYETDYSATGDTTSTIAITVPVCSRLRPMFWFKQFVDANNDGGTMTLDGRVVLSTLDSIGSSDRLDSNTYISSIVIENSQSDLVVTRGPTSAMQVFTQGYIYRR